MATVYYAKWLMSPNGDVVNNAAIAVDGNRILAAGARSAVRRASGDRMVNLGDVLLLPGLINMHTHLEESVLRGAVKEETETFASWITKNAARIRQTPLDVLLPAVRLSIREFLTFGTTTIVDSTRTGTSLPILKEEPIRAWMVQEIRDDDDARAEVLGRTLAVRKRLAEDAGRLSIAVGPYALFSLAPQAHRTIAAAARDGGLVWAGHLAESAEELQAFAEQTGDLYFQITRRRPWPFDHTSMGPMQCAISHDCIPDNAVLFHCNYVNGQELSLLAAKNASIVVCFHYSRLLGHKEFPLDVALSRGVNICAATESVFDLGSVSLFDELHALKTAYPHIPAKELLRWVTVNPARALHASDKIGSLAAGLYADIIGVSFAHDAGEDLLEELMMEYPDVRFVMVDGEEVIAHY